MSYQAKFIIPLLNENITKEDISDNSGFIGFYTEHAKYPKLQNHIFLLYKPNMASKKCTEMHNRFKKFNNMLRILPSHDDKGIYYLYIFTITNNTILRIQTGCFALNAQEQMRLMLFWKLEDNDINEYMCNNDSIKKHTFKTEYLT